MPIGGPRPTLQESWLAVFDDLTDDIFLDRVGSASVFDVVVGGFFVDVGGGLFEAAVEVDGVAALCDVGRLLWACGDVAGGKSVACDGPGVSVFVHELEHLGDVSLGFFEGRDAAVCFDGAGTGVVGGERHLFVAFVEGEELGEVLGAAGDILGGVEDLADAHFCGSAGHQLHESACAGFGDGPRVEATFDFDDGEDECFVDAVDGCVAFGKVADIANGVGVDFLVGIEPDGNDDGLVIDIDFDVVFIFLVALWHVCHEDSSLRILKVVNLRVITLAGAVAEYFSLREVPGCRRRLGGGHAVCRGMRGFGCRRVFGGGVQGGARKGKDQQIRWWEWGGNWG